MLYKYTKLETSIEETSFEYILNLDDYKALLHILNIISVEKIKKPLLSGLFKKIISLFDNTIKRLSYFTKGDGKTIDIDKLKTFTKDNSVKKIILVKSDDYGSFASYTSGVEDNPDKLKNGPKTILYNIGQLETSGSISVVPTNANVFLSNLLY